MPLRYFDAHGNYYTKEDPDNVQDNWLQDVDWNKVERRDGVKRGMKRERKKQA